MIRSTSSRSLIALAILAALGCGQSQKPSTQSPALPTSEAQRETNAQPAANAVDAATSSGDVTVEIKDFDGVQELIASKRGKVVVMDCWSTWCDPCVKEFPGLVELHNQFSPDDLACVSLSFNYGGGKKETPEEYTEPVLEFLTAQKAAFDNVIASVSPDELYQKLGFKTAAIPAIFVYDREGNIARQFEGEEAKYSEVSKLVAELIDKSPTASQGGAEK